MQGPFKDVSVIHYEDNARKLRFLEGYDDVNIDENYSPSTKAGFAKVIPFDFKDKDYESEKNNSNIIVAPVDVVL